MKKRFSLIFLVCVILASLAILASCQKSDKCDHEYEDATCTEPKTCEECGKTKGEPLGHNFAAATCTSPATCTVCSATEGMALGHNFKPATCTAPQTCSVCYMSQGVPLGHKGGVATCTNKAVCEVCNNEYGELNTANHTEDAVWQKRYTEHQEMYPCCGMAISSKESHSMSGGTCTVCGYDPTIIVSSADAEIGGEVVVYVSISDNIGLIGLDISVFYDENTMTLVSVEAGNAMKELQFSAPEYLYSGSKFLFDGVSIDDKNIRDGEFLVLTFSVSSWANSGHYSVYAKVNKALDNDLNEPSLKLVSGTVTIK